MQREFFLFSRGISSSNGAGVSLRGVQRGDEQGSERGDGNGDGKGDDHRDEQARVYIYGDKGQTRCPSGSHLVTNQQECQVYKIP